MFSVTPEEVVDAFCRAKNLNATIKKILRQEVKRGSAEERFFKDFRGIALSPKCNELLEGFVARHFPREERLLMVVAGYAYDEAMVAISGAIIDKYADEFNDTYEMDGSEVRVKDDGKFEQVARSAVAMIEDGLTEASLPASPFMKNVLVSRLFTSEVIEKLRPLFS